MIDHEGISIGQKAILGPYGIERVVESGMNEGELLQWQAAKKKVAEIVSRCMN